MDAKSEIMTLKLNGDFTDSCILYRNSHQQYVNKDNSPKPNAFAFENGMSCDWDKYTTPEECIIRVGLTLKANQDYKTPDLFSLFGIKVGDIKIIEGVSSIDFSPILNVPEKVGVPNNPSHSDVWVADPEVRLKFAETAKYVKLDREFINNTVNKLRPEIIIEAEASKKLAD